MRAFLLTTALVLLAPAAAHACSCAPDTDGSQAARVLANPAISVVDVTVRGFNTRNGQSMLQIDNVLHGGLVARDIRAKFAAHSCGVVPNQKKMTLLVHNDSDGRYSIGDLCDTQAVLKKMGK